MSGNIWPAYSGRALNPRELEDWVDSLHANKNRKLDIKLSNKLAFIDMKARLGSSSISTMNVDEAEDSFKNSKNSEKDLAFRNWLCSCSNTDEAQHAFKSTQQDHRLNWAFKRWLELCKTDDDARYAFKYTGNSKRQDWAFKRWLELCKTDDDARYAFKYTGNPKRKEWAKKRMEELS